LWFFAYAAWTRTSEEARAALEALPADGLPPYNIRFRPQADAGRVFLLGGRAAEALPYLRIAALGCDGLAEPIGHVEAAYYLGQALETTGNKSGACDAYQTVLHRWGSAKPRSITAEKARERSKTLGCPK
jgi:serine/threonine-protein kinase